MSTAYISNHLKRLVSEEAQYRCGYCQTSQHIIGQPMTFDHLTPEALGGATEQDNLWLACRRCNEFKGSLCDASDPLTHEKVPLYNPRNQSWSVHFAWSKGGVEIVGLTKIGRATVQALRLNNPEIVGARALWVQVGWHPPKD